MKKVLIFCIFIVTLYSPVTGSPVNLPLDHWAYSFIERMETKGYLDTLAYRTKPYTRGECAEIIIHINSRLAREEIQLSKTELSLFEKLKGEFYDELQKEKIEINTKEKEPHLYTWREKKSMFHWDAYLAEDYRHLPDGDNSDYSSRTTLGSIIRGSLEDKIYFYLDFRNTLIKGEELDKNYIPSQGLPVGTAGKNTYQDQAVAYLSYKFSWGEFAVGRDFFNWGPGYRGSLALSPYSEVIDMFKITVRFKRFKFTSISGILNSELGKKNISAHRIEFRFFPNLIFSGYETVIYGNRGLELIYVNPLMPYHIAEHYQQDKDNNTMGFDIIYRPVNNLKIYSELFLDDFNSSKNPFTYYGNKWAFLSGMHYTDPFSLPDTDFRAEYTRIEPYVYTHTIPINTYTNYDRTLGHWLGPNADYFFAEISHQHSRALKISASFENRRRGKGDITEPYKSEYGEEKKFLDGIVEKEQAVRLGFEYEIKRDVYFSLSYRYSSINNYERTEGITKDNNVVNFVFCVNW